MAATLWRSDDSFQKSKPYPKSRATQNELTRPVQNANIFMGDLHDINKNTLAPLSVENVVYHEKVTCIEWTITNGQVNKDIE